MNSTHFKLIAVDLDGTLLDSNSQISEENRETIRRVRATGMQVMICTGRGSHSVKPFLETLDILDAPLVLRNGAFSKLSYDGDYLHRHVLEHTLARRVTKRLMESNLHPVVCVCDEEHEKFYIMERTMTDEVQREFYQCFHPQLKEEDDLLTAEYAQVSVVGAVGDEEHLRMVEGELAQEFREDIGSHVILLPSGDFYFEAYKKGINKWVGLESVMQHLACSTEEVFVLGDAINDLDMIRCAGYGVAMQNGDPACKEVADEIAPPNNEHGVAVVLQKHFLS